MQGLVSVWRILTPAKRLMLVGAVAAVVVSFSILARTASTPKMALLYAGLDGRTAGQVVAALERMNVPFDVRGEAIYVPAAKRDSVRMSLAGEGLPETGQAGYELLDNLNGFSTTSDMFGATYWRAREGELARTILATPGVKAARVHIAAPQTGAFARNRPAPSASVTVVMGAERLSRSQAQAIRYLVASAVPGLPADQVAIIDSSRGVVLEPGRDEEVVDVKDAADRAQALENDILELLEARVGPGNARVNVALEIDREREAVSEKIFNPDTRVVTGKETTEITETTQGRGGAVTVASNLPEGDGAAGAGSRTERAETRETVTYGVSETTRQREKLPGSIRKMSVAVIVNQVAENPAEEGGEPILRTEEELAALRELVARAAGLDESRGDTLTIQALPFRAAPDEGVLVEANPIGDFLERHLMHVIQTLILAVVTLVLALFVVKPLLAPKNLPAPSAEAQPQPSLADAAGAPAALAGEGPAGALPAAEPDAIATLRELAGAKSDETAKLIQSWLDAAEDAA
ncbi:MAG: flagellar basal-body MS-ring/collar protein FliF [Amphiplicatus sp.]